MKLNFVTYTPLGQRSNIQPFIPIVPKVIASPPESTPVNTPVDTPVIEPVVEHVVARIPVITTTAAPHVPTQQIVQAFANPTTKDHTYQVDVENEIMKGFLDQLSQNNVFVTVTSAKREPGKNKKSHHITGKAIDIVPQKGTSLDALYKQLLNNQNIINYMRTHKIGIFDERTKKSKDWTGAHLHIGPDQIAIAQTNEQIAKGKKGLKLNSKEYFTKELDTFIKKNPKYRGINTSEFKNFFTELAALESSFNQKAVSKDKNGNKGSYVGWFQLHKNKLKNLEPTTQFKEAYKHLSNILKERITTDDFNQMTYRYMQGKLPSNAAYLAKLWNQGSKATNWLYNEIDSEDGAGTKISSYGNNIDENLDYEKYVPKSLVPGTTYVVKKGDNLNNIAQRVRFDGRTRFGDISEFTQWKQIDPKTLQIGTELTLPSNHPYTKEYIENQYNKFTTK